MVEPNNPFQSPTSNDPVGGAFVGSSVQTSQRAIELLARTRPWVKVMVVVGRLGIIFMAIGLVALLAMAVTGASRPGGEGGLPAMFVAAIYGLMLVVYWFPVMYLSKYASQIKQLTTTGDAVLLDEALDAQRKFWKFMGIGVLAFIALYFVIIAGVALLGTALRAGA